MQPAQGRMSVAMGRKYAVVTGGAGAIAHCLIDDLVERGYHVFALDIAESQLADTEKKFGSAHVSPIQCDITSDEQVAAAAATVRSRVSDASLNLLVNNAGLERPGDFADIPWSAAQLQVNVNLLGAMRVTHMFVPLLKAPASIINIISMAGIIATKGSAAYTASKFGFRGFNAALAQELRPRRIAVSGVFPSAVDTPSLRQEAKDGGNVLNFVGKPVKPKDVSRLAMKALQQGKVEYYACPQVDNLLSRVCGGVWPSLGEKILPTFEKKGAKGRDKFLARIAAEEASDSKTGTSPSS